MVGRLKRSLKLTFIAGFFVLIPVIISVYVIWRFYSFLDGVVSPLYKQNLGHSVPGLGFITAIVIIFLFGLIATNVVGQKVLHWWDSFLKKIPIFRIIYTAVKQITDILSPNKKSAFKEVVIVEHPRKGEYVFGFKTNEITLEKSQDEKEELISVFVPTNNLYLGDVIMVKKEEAINTELSVEEGIRIILSGGSSAPNHIKKT